MKTEAQIRAHRDDLAKLLAKPCDCAERGGLHAFECFIGCEQMKQTIRVMSWVLGEREDYEREVEVMAAGARAS